MLYRSYKEIFDVVSEHLLTQMAVSEKDQKCCYRSDSGLKCAIGVLIPDSMYTPEMDKDYGLFVGELMAIPAFRGQFSKYLFPVVVEKRGQHTSLGIFLQLLQNLHDKTSPDAWATGLARLERMWSKSDFWEVPSAPG